MKKGLIGLLSLLMVAAFAGCGGSTPEPQENAAPVETTSTDSKADAEGSAAAEKKDDGHSHAPGEEAHSHAPEEAAPAAAEGSDTAAKDDGHVHAPGEEAHSHAPEETAPTAAEGSDTAAKEEAAAVVDGLAGTKWTYKGIELTFKEGNKVFLKGGPLAALAPDGTDADYTLKDGAIEVSVLGQTYSGTYADGKLVIDDNDAVMMQ